MDFLLGWSSGDRWEDWVARRRDNAVGRRVPRFWVPSTFLGAFDPAGILIGRASIRHTLNPWLRSYGGHIGYAVHPDHRRRGYGTEILHQAVIVARALGIDEILVMCDDTNIASARVIEANGGELDAVVAGEDGLTRERQYWIRCPPPGTARRRVRRRERSAPSRRVRPA